MFGTAASVATLRLLVRLIAIIVLIFMQVEAVGVREKEASDKQASDTRLSMLSSKRINFSQNVSVQHAEDTLY